MCPRADLYVTVGDADAMRVGERHDELLKEVARLRLRHTLQLRQTDRQSGCRSGMGDVKVRVRDSVIVTVSVSISTGRQYKVPLPMSGRVSRDDLASVSKPHLTRAQA